MVSPFDDQSQGVSSLVAESLAADAHPSHTPAGLRSHTALLPGRRRPEASTCAAFSPHAALLSLPDPTHYTSARRARETAPRPTSLCPLPAYLQTCSPLFWSDHSSLV